MNFSFVEGFVSNELLRPYCISTVSWFVCLSVGWSVYQAMSAQYFFIPLLKSCQTRCCGYSEGVDGPYCISRHIIKGQGQTPGLNP